MAAEFEGKEGNPLVPEAAKPFKLSAWRSRFGPWRAEAILKIPAQRLTAPARRPMPRRGLVGQQVRFVPLPVLLLVALSGCASLLPAPRREWVILKTSTSTQYYSVRGTATGALFDDIERNGLSVKGTQRAAGLTSAEWRIVWSGVDTRAALCIPPPMTITLHLRVTLPQHEQLNDLSEAIRANWQRFAARVAAHEQRHVDIYLAGAKAMKARVEAALTRWSPCSELETSIRGLLASQQAETENAQDRFHVEDDAKIQSDRKPLQARIEDNQARLAAIESEIRDLNLTLEGLGRELDAARAKIDTANARIAKPDDGSPSDCSRARSTSPVQALCQQYNGLVAAHNALVEQHNEAAYRQNDLAEEHRRVLAVTNGLIDALNWTR
jgi:predicted secreted Zn-dependent protease